MDISVIVPVYNGEKTIKKLLQGIRENLKAYGSFEVLFVYDRGSDNSWGILIKLQKEDPQKVRIFKLNKNYGQHNAILFGLSRSEGELIITMDEDLQHDPNCLGPLIEKQREGNYNIVYGRYIDPKHPFFRKVASKFLQKLLKIMIPGLGYYSSFRLLKKDIALKITMMKNSYTFIDACLNSVTSDFGYLDIDHRENKTRRSTYNFFKLASHAIQIILAYTSITKWIFTISIVLIIFACVSNLFDLTVTRIQIDLFITGLVFLLAGISGEVYHKRKGISNSRPVIANESY
jgi:glycosyltransferase involved in cell wall biosynthesis